MNDIFKSIKLIHILRIINMYLFDSIIWSIKSIFKDTFKVKFYDCVYWFSINSRAT